MARLSGVDLPNDKRVEIGLTYVFGIGRTRALETLAAYRISSTVSAEAPQLAGVQAAVAAGAGVALMATLGQTPAGLFPRYDLPRAVPLELTVCARQGLAAPLLECVADAVRRLIAEPADQLDAADQPLAC